MTEREHVSMQGLTKVLLMSLGAGAVISAALLFPGAGMLFKELEKNRWNQLRKRGSLRSTIRRLEKQKLVSWREQGGELALSLTENGKKKVLQYNIDDLTVKQTKPDSLLRVIVFDIPESRKLARNIFRKKLKSMGFFQWQKSVFVTPYECKDQIDILRHNLNISQYVQYILAKQIPGLSLKGR